MRDRTVGVEREPSCIAGDDKTMHASVAKTVHAACYARRHPYEVGTSSPFAMRSEAAVNPKFAHL